MNRLVATKKTPFVIVSIMVVLALFVPAQSARAASVTLAAPNTYSLIKLQQKEGYGVNFFTDFSLKLEGWACDTNNKEKFADRTISKIRQINFLIQPLASAGDSLAALEKTFIKADWVTKEQVDAAVSKTIHESINKAGFSSERSFIDKAESLSKETLAQAKAGMNAVFDYSQNDKLFEQEFSSRPPWGAWKLSKIDQDESSVVYIVENCYQKSDLDKMMNAIVSAANKLEEAVKKFKDAKKKALAQAPTMVDAF